MRPVDNKAVAARLRRLRAKRGLSQKECAEALGIDPSGLSRFESGEFQLTIEFVFSYCAILGVSPAKVVTFPEDELEAALTVAAA